MSAPRVRSLARARACAAAPLRTARLAPRDSVVPRAACSLQKVHTPSPASESALLRAARAPLLSPRPLFFPSSTLVRVPLAADSSRTEPAESAPELGDRELGDAPACTVRGRLRSRSAPGEVFPSNRQVILR